jgi:hypothetical protein
LNRDDLRLGPSGGPCALATSRNQRTHVTIECPANELLVTFFTGFFPPSDFNSCNNWSSVVFFFNQRFFEPRRIRNRLRAMQAFTLEKDYRSVP